jgi:hypothetical protein
MSRIATCALALLAGGPLVRAQVTYQRIDLANNAGDVKLVGDIDLDGTVDVVLGGSRNEGLNWYHYPDWTGTRIATPTVEFTTDGALGDVDGDGDLDVVVPDGSSGTNLLWFENPARNHGAANGNPFSAAQWRRHALGTIGSWGKDVHLADLDRNGLIDVVARSSSICYAWFQDAGDVWTRVEITRNTLGQEGLAIGDIDVDGHVDVVAHGVWIRNPGGSAARTTSHWTTYRIDSNQVDPAFKALVADLDGDARPDVLYSSSENTAEVLWYSHAGDPRGPWTPHTILASANRAHTLQAADLDGDGDTDVIVGFMHTSNTPGVRAFYNRNGLGTSWQMQVVDSTNGVHNGVIADIGADGDFELLGANWTGNPPLRAWINRTPATEEILTVPSLTPEVNSTFRVTNCIPNSIVVCWITAAGTTAPYPTGLGTTFDLANPVILSWGVCGPNGVIDFEITMPAIMSRRTLWVQSMEIGRKSNVVARRVR